MRHTWKVPIQRGGRKPLDETTDHVGEMCHDLRQPVAAILFLAATAADEIGDEDAVRRRLRQISSEAVWMASLVDSGDDGDVPRPLDVAAVVRDCTERVAVATGATVRCEAGATPVTSASPVGLRRALSNVMQNAARAAGPYGEVTVRVLEQGDDVVVEVDDDGPGFGQLPVVHGLGLDITRKELARFGASLDVSSAPSGCTRVRLRLRPGARDVLRGSLP